MEESHHRSVIRGGIRSGALGGSAVVIGALALNRFNPPVWSRLTPALKANAGVILTLMSFFWGCDRASSDFLGLTHAQKNEMVTDLSKENVFDTAIDKFKENRWNIIFGTWVAGMGASWLYVSRQPLPFRQKIVQARMPAQAITIAVVGASAGIASIKTPKSGSKTQEEDTAIIKEAARYRFKEGSIADKRLQEAERRTSIKTD